MQKTLIKESVQYSKMYEEAWMCITNSIYFARINDNVAETSFAEKIDVSYEAN